MTRSAREMVPHFLVFCSLPFAAGRSACLQQRASSQSLHGHCTGTSRTLQELKPVQAACAAAAVMRFVVMWWYSFTSQFGTVPWKRSCVDMSHGRQATNRQVVKAAASAGSVTLPIASTLAHTRSSD